MHTLDVQRSTISGNALYNPMGAGYNLAGGSGTREHNVVANNVATNPGGPGIDVKLARSLIIGNYVEGASDWGIDNPARSRDRNSIRGNHLYQTQKGILATGTDTSICDNHLVKIDQTGIEVEDPQEMTVMGNDIHGVNTNAGGYDAIKTSDAGTGGTRTVIAYNVISEFRGAPDVGINIAANSGVRTIKGNIVFGANTSRYDISEVPATLRDNDPEVPYDVRNLAAMEGNEGYHDGSGSNTVGPAFYDGSAGVSLVDGSSIS